MDLSTLHYNVRAWMCGWLRRTNSNLTDRHRVGMMLRPITKDDFSRGPGKSVHVLRYKNCWCSCLTSRNHQPPLASATPWSRVLLGVVKLVKKFLPLHGTRRCIIMLSRTYHWAVSRTTAIKSTPPHPISTRSMLIVHPDTPIHAYVSHASCHFLPLRSK
jgi:hypothetical protein